MQSAHTEYCEYIYCVADLCGAELVLFHDGLAAIVNSKSQVFYSPWMTVARLEIYCMENLSRYQLFAEVNAERLNSGIGVHFDFPGSV